ncbi:MAG: HAD-IIIA family hydrolase [Patescibacteria group bacterium]|nr:HAD-IIIA family hydrolase [Patescibacteria group bacterium]
MDKGIWPEIRLLVCDFDGVLTDGKVVVGTDGVESVVCSHADGQGIELVRKAGIPVVVISGQKSPYVDPRCRKMKIDFFRAIKDKPVCLRGYLAKHYSDVTLDQVCYVGDDRSDLAVMRIVGLPVAVQNATDEIKEVAAYVTARCGGDGGVREVCDLLLDAKAATDTLARAQNVLITGTGQAATERVREEAQGLAYRLALLGYNVLTNGGPNGVPWAAAMGVRQAIDEGHSARLIAYVFDLGLTTEKCGATEIRCFATYEDRNGAICRDADIAVFYQGGLGTMAKLLTLLHRAVHVNAQLTRRGLGSCVLPKRIILDQSFLGSSSAEDPLLDKLGRFLKDEHRAAIRIANGSEDVLEGLQV